MVRTTDPDADRIDAAVEACDAIKSPVLNIRQSRRDATRYYVRAARQDLTEAVDGRWLTQYRRFRIDGCGPPSGDNPGVEVVVVDCHD